MRAAPTTAGRRRPDVRPSERFAALYEANFAFVWRALRRLGIRGAATEDAAQEVWLVAFRHLDDLDPERSPRPWLYTIARRIAWRQRRTRTRADRKVRALAVAPTKPPADVSARVEATQVIESLLERLPAEQRRVFVLSELLSMTGKEIAASLGVKQATVYSRLRLARRRLDTMVAEDARADAIAALREEDRPAADQRQRSWALLLPGLGAPPAAPLPSAPTASLGERLIAAVTTHPAITGAAAAVLGAAIFVGAATRDADPEPTVDDPVEVQTTAAQARQQVAETNAPKQQTEPEEPKAPKEPTGLDNATPPADVERSAAEPPRAADTNTTNTPIADRDDPLAREAALLREAREALGAGQAQQALERLDAHAREFSGGALTDVREASRVEALCALGRADEAARAAHDLAARHPDSMAARVAAEGCTTSGDGP